MAMLPSGSEPLKELLGWAPRPTHPAPVVIRARGGQKFNFKPLLQNNPTAIYVKVDGVMMMENHDYFIDMAAGEITFNTDVQKIYGGEEIEIRSTGPDVDPLKRVLLLARKNGLYEFTDEELQEMAEQSIGAIFSVDQIAKYGDNATKLEPFAGKKLQVLSFEVTEEGLVGTGQRVIVDG